MGLRGSVRAAKPTQKQRAQLRRKEAGRWLRELREKRGLSQRELAEISGVDDYRLISQLENGHRGHIPPDRYLHWAFALGVEPRVFVRRLMSYYDPVTYKIIFPVRGRLKTRDCVVTAAGPRWLMRRSAQAFR
jgi:transcriptional regulator with XRE-family HTH domain